MEPSAEDTNAVVTLQVLEERLHRLEVLLHGSLHSIDTSHPTSVPATRDDTVSTRLTNIESGLHRLASRYGVVQDVLDLYARYPDLFVPRTDDQPPSTLDIFAITSIVLAHAISFSEAISRLTSVKDLPIPPASVSAELIALQPRLDKLKEVQEAQVNEVAELRAGSARLLERWLDVGVVGQGEVWAEWEEKLRAVERGVRRIEVAREKDEG